MCREGRGGTDTLTVNPDEGYKLDTLTVTYGGVTASVEFTIARANPTNYDFTVKSRPDNFTYNGEAKTYTIEPAEGRVGMGNITIKYYDENDEPVSAAINAGFYTVKIPVTEGENYNATEIVYHYLTINKTTSTVTKAPEAVSSLTFNGSNQSLVTAGTTTGGTMQYSLSENGDYSTATPTNAGSYTVSVDVAEGDNYLAATGIAVGTFTINGADPTYTAPTAVHYYRLPYETGRSLRSYGIHGKRTL